MQYLCFSVICFVQIFALVIGECTDNCESSGLYADLNCKPVFEKKGDCCPIKYDCSHIDNRPKDKCHLRGVFYKPGANIDDDLVYGNCHVNCHCKESTDYTCAILDCPEWLGVIPKPNCYLKHEVGKCCSVGQICSPFPDDLAKCKVGDKEYKEGEKFSAPGQKCVDCVCKKGFAGKYIEPFCRKSNCSVEIRHSGDVRQNCAPAYQNIGDCCPWDWICPEEADTIQVSATPKKADLQCKFGEKKLNIGDKLERIKVMSEYERYETKCECLVPPFLTCTHKQIFVADKIPVHLKGILST